MKKCLLVLTLLVGVIFTAGASPATSNAANCTYQATNDTIWTGTSLAFGAYISGCTDDVDKIEFSGVGQNASGWFDATWQTYVQATSMPLGENGRTVKITVRPGPQKIYGVQYFGPAWCSHQTHAVSEYFNWRIHNEAAAPSVWGQWHSSFRAVPHNIVC